MEGDKQSKFVTISIEKDVYFGNTDIKGEVTFGEPPRPTTLKTVMIILWARYIEYPRNGGPRESMSLHMSRRPVAQEMELIPGEEPTVVPFQFTIPSDVPSSIMTPLGAVQWRIAVVHEITGGRGVAAIAAKLFRKGTLYHSLPTFLPTAQSEITLPVSKNILRAEATLSRDVYAEGDEVGVHVTIHESGAHKAPAVTLVKAKIMQYMSVGKKGRPMLRPPIEMKLDRVKQDISDWQITYLAGDAGTVAEHTLRLTPKLDYQGIRTRCAHQIVDPGDSAAGRPRVNTLAPTCKYSSDGKEVYLTYEVKVEIRTPSGHDILLTLPFTLQNQPGEALTLARAAEEDPEEFMLKVPAYATIDDELPAYDEVEQMSVPTYTTLRRNSANTIFMLAATTISDPNLLTVADSDLGVPDSVTQQASMPDVRDLDRPVARRRSSILSIFSPDPSSAGVGDAQRRRSSSFVNRFSGQAPANNPDEPDATGSSPPAYQKVTRRKSAASLLLENSVAATANRTYRRLRASTLGQPPTHPSARRRSTAHAEEDEPEENPERVLADFKARYGAQPAVTLEHHDGVE